MFDDTEQSNRRLHGDRLSQWTVSTGTDCRVGVHKGDDVDKSVLVLVLNE